MIKNNTIADIEKSQLLAKVPKQELETLIVGYQQYIGKLKYVRFIVFGFIALILGYNVFIAGKRYTISESNTIKTVMVTVIGSLVIALLVFMVIFIIDLRKLKKQLYEISTKHHLDKKQLKREFDVHVKTVFGGPGLR